MYAGWIDGTRWTTNTADWITRSTWQDWMWPVAVICVIVGLWLVWLAVKPRRRTHVPLGDFEVMWTRRGDMARVRVPHCSPSPGRARHDRGHRRRAKVTVTVSGGVDEQTMRDRVAEALAPVKHPPRVVIRRVVRSKEARS